MTIQIIYINDRIEQLKATSHYIKDNFLHIQFIEQDKPVYSHRVIPMSNILNYTITSERAPLDMREYLK